MFEELCIELTEQAQHRMPWFWYDKWRQFNKPSNNKQLNVTKQIIDSSLVVDFN